MTYLSSKSMLEVHGLIIQTVKFTIALINTLYSTNLSNIVHYFKLNKDKLRLNVKCISFYYLIMSFVPIKSRNNSLIVLGKQ